MADLSGRPTHENLKEAFAAEAEDVHRYLYFAGIAEIEGWPDIATLFREVGESGICAAHGHLDFLKRVGDPSTGLPIGETERNLAAAIATAAREATALYPSLAAAARADGFPDVASWFENLARQKGVQVRRLEDARATLAGSRRPEGA
jgi:rubrerythrin